MERFDLRDTNTDINNLKKGTERERESERARKRERERGGDFRYQMGIPSFPWTKMRWV